MIVPFLLENCVFCRMAPDIVAKCGDFSCLKGKDSIILRYNDWGDIRNHSRAHRPHGRAGVSVEITQPTAAPIESWQGLLLLFRHCPFILLNMSPRR